MVSFHVFGTMDGDKHVEAETGFVAVCAETEGSVIMVLSVADGPMSEGTHANNPPEKPNSVGIAAGMKA